MSNDVISLIQNSLSTIEGGIDEDTRAVAGNGAASKRISIKGGVFRKMVGGKEIGAIDDRHMNVIIVCVGLTTRAPLTPRSRTLPPLRAAVARTA